MKKLGKLLAVFAVSLLVIAPFITVDAKTTKKKTTTTTTTTTVKVAENAITVYVFHRDTCPHCQELREYLDTLKKDSKVNYMFKVVEYEVSTSQENYNLMLSVGEYFDYEVDGVPFYVIGDEYFSGFGDSSKDSLKEAIEEAYNDSNYKDVVSAIVDGTATKDEEDSKMSNNTVGLIILGITVVIIVVLIISSSKNKYYEDEVEEKRTKTNKKK